MTSQKRWHGLITLIQDAIEHGSTAVQNVHEKTAARPFDILEQVPGVATPTRVVRLFHDATVSTVYFAIRSTNRVLAVAVDAAFATPPAADARREQLHESNDDRKPC